LIPQCGFCVYGGKDQEEKEGPWLPNLVHESIDLAEVGSPFSLYSDNLSNLRGSYRDTIIGRGNGECGENTSAILDWTNPGDGYHKEITTSIKAMNL
jgi:hypothetical protein